jgi:hypothetical protein
MMSDYQVFFGIFFFLLTSSYFNEGDEQLDTEYVTVSFIQFQVFRTEEDIYYMGLQAVAKQALCMYNY